MNAAPSTARSASPTVPSRLVYNGLREAEFETVPAAPDAADFLYIGMMRDLKGPDLFIDALAQVEMRLGRKVTAVMVGDGEDLPRYEAQVKRLGLDDRVRFLKPMPARQAFALAGIVVVPSRAEAMPYIVLEALAAGKPMIATAVGGIPEIFGAGSPALVRPDAGELAERMADALADPAAFAAKMPDVGRTEGALRRRRDGRRDREGLFRRAHALTCTRSAGRSNATRPFKGFLALFCYRNAERTGRQQHEQRSSRRTASPRKRSASMKATATRARPASSTRPPGRSPRSTGATPCPRSWSAACCASSSSRCSSSPARCCSSTMSASAPISTGTIRPSSPALRCSRSSCSTSPTATSFRR